MATYFEVAIASAEATYAAQAAAAVFRQVDRLEQELSRFVPSSDIARINRLAAGESTVVGEDAFECLLLSADVFLATHGAFDAAYRSDASAASANSGTETRSTDRDPRFELDPATHTVVSRAPRLELDLGAIGKGYALDVGAKVLEDWKLPSACLVAGGSTVVALSSPPDQPGWRIGVGDEPQVQPLSLADASISASGIAVQGRHILDPRSGQPAPRQTRAWALAGSGAQSDALSTAFFVMTDEEVAAFCREHPMIGAALTQRDGTLRTFGALSGRLV